MTDIAETEFHKLFKASLHENTLVVTPVGDSISFRDSDVETELETLINIAKSGKVNHLVVNLGQSDYFGTIVIGAFNKLGSVIKEQGGKATLCECSEDMESILKVMNLDRIWPNFVSLEIALDFVKS